MKKIQKEFIILILIVSVFIGLRSINYIYHLNWSGDQGSFAIETLRLFQTKTLTLIGPQISANLDGRFIFQGPLIYYGFMAFLFIGRWDPATASYFFMVFCAVMIFPLYYGAKKLINSKAAWILVIIYSFLPYYINYTRFLWNTTLLLSLLPFLILFMGFYKEKRIAFWFFMVSVWLGVLLQFHYQFILIIFGIFCYYFVFKRVKPVHILLFVSGISLGFLPLILFEFKHNFYNLHTMILFAQNWSKVDKPGGITMPHYYISISFMIIVTILSLFAKRINKISYLVIGGSAVILSIYSLILYVPKPLQAFWAPAERWNYVAEKKVYDIIRSTKIRKDFNIANLAYYDTKSVVIKFFMKRDGYNIDYEDYYHNKYLFVVSKDEDYIINKSYEVDFFKPRVVLREWKINQLYNLFLLERK